MSADWYYNLDGAQYGPMDEAELVRLIQASEIPPGVLVCQLGMMNWEPAREHACFQVEVYPRREAAARAEQPPSAVPPVILTSPSRELSANGWISECFWLSRRIRNDQGGADVSHFGHHPFRH